MFSGASEGFAIPMKAVQLKEKWGGVDLKICQADNSIQTLDKFQEEEKITIL